jgi:carboxyl-terminal processing protease
MSDKAKSIIAAGWIALAAGAFIVGSSVRDRVDLAAPSPGANLDNLVASRDNSMSSRAQQDIPAGDFFYELTEKLKKEYYEPIGDEQKLASGAVRGMIGYLGDPNSIFMDKKEFQTYLRERQGKYEGIGADLEVLMVKPGASGSSVASHGPVKLTVGGFQNSVVQPTTPDDVEEAKARSLSPAASAAAVPFPRLAVVSVVPGGPADRAGVRAGDLVYSVDDHWVINPDLAARFNHAENEFRAHRLGWPELNAIRKEVRSKYDHMILPLRAKDRLALGTSGTVKIVWERDGQQRATTIVRGASTMPGFLVSGDRITLPFTPDSPALLRRAIEGKSAVTIDLRNNTLGDFGVMRQCIAAVAPTGVYGFESNDRGGKPTPLKVSEGNPNPPKITLLTDRSTRGPAEIFALALSSRGIAKLSGEDTGGGRDVYEIVQLPDGSGYTLATSRYRTAIETKPAKSATKTIKSRVAVAGEKK